MKELILVNANEQYKKDKRLKIFEKVAADYPEFKKKFEEYEEKEEEEEERKKKMLDWSGIEEENESALRDENEDGINNTKEGESIHENNTNQNNKEVVKEEEKKANDDKEEVVKIEEKKTNDDKHDVEEEEKKTNVDKHVMKKEEKKTNDDKHVVEEEEKKTNDDKHVMKKEEKKTNVDKHVVKEVIEGVYNVSKDELSTKQTLLLLRKILYSIQIMHNNNFYHGDIFSRNIMINNDLDFSIVDLDSAIIDDIVSEENTYYYDDMTIEQSIDRTIFDDKIDTLKMFLGFLAHGTFNECISLPIDINILNLPPIIYDEIKYCLSRKIIDQDYYFLDIIDELLSIGYESKILTK